MRAVIYYTDIPEQYREKRLEHMLGEELLRRGLMEEFGLRLEFEPRAKGEHGKPFLTLQPRIRYNISHSGNYVLCILTSQEVGIDIERHREVNVKRLRMRVAKEELAAEILKDENSQERFFNEWVLREAYIKWTGEGLSRDLRSIPMDSGEGTLLPFREGYSCAVWSQSALEIEWKKLEIALSKA